MTDICSGGTSSAKPGVAPTIFMSSSAAGALLNNVPTVWAVPLAAYIGLLTYQASSFCATDPPADPGITALDVANLLAGPLNPGAGAAAQKVAQLVSRYAWYQFCQCDTVATPAPPAPPAEPSGAPDLNPPYLPPTTVQPCGQFEGTHVEAAGPVLAAPAFIGGGRQGSFSGAIAVPPNATHVTIPWDVSVAPSGFTQNVQYEGYNAAGSFVEAGPGANFTSAPASGVIEKDIGSTVRFFKVVAFIGDTTHNGPMNVHGIAKFFCGGTNAGQPAAPCCPPDPLLDAKIDQVLNLVTLIQRQISPFASIDGTAHAGLTGNGHIDLAEKLLGVRVQLTTIPSSYGVAAGDPAEHFDLGWVHLGDGDQWFGERQLEQQTSIWQPRWAGMATRIGYTLSPGVVATIVELKREP